MTPQLYRQRALEFALAARPLALRYFQQSELASAQKSDASPVSAADRDLDALLCRLIAEHFPGHGVWAEESGKRDDSAEYLWLVDAIDGTKSFIAGNPMFGSTLGLWRDGEPVFGSLDFPALGWHYSGGLDLPCQRAGVEQPLRVKPGVDLAESYICLNEAELFWEHRPRAYQALRRSCRYLRLTHDCFSYAQLLAGKVDAVIELDLKAWDFAPLAAMVPSAGGVISDFSGRALELKPSADVVASANSDLHQQIVQLLIDN